MFAFDQSAVAGYHHAQLRKEAHRDAQARAALAGRRSRRRTRTA